jgi:NTP pyrophosphatase (non-canonical NTP hydrolase)
MRPRSDCRTDAGGDGHRPPYAAYQVLAAGVECVRRPAAFLIQAVERTDDRSILKLHEEVGELTQAYLARTGQARDKGRTPEEVDGDARAELADVLGQVLLLAEWFGVDVATEVERKWLARRTSQ